MIRQLPILENVMNWIIPREMHCISWQDPIINPVTLRMQKFIKVIEEFPNTRKATDAEGLMKGL